MDRSLKPSPQEVSAELWPRGLRNPLPPQPADDGLPAVAVVIRTKNRPLLLRRACESVLAQSFVDWITVIVNDGGDPAEVDAAVRPLQSLFNGRLLIKHNATSLGMEGASNVGVHASRSRYVVIHDDDDTWQPDFLAECVRYLDEDKHGRQCAGVATLTTIVREQIEDGKITQLGTAEFNPDQKNISIFQMAGRNSFTNNAFVFRRGVYDAVGGFNEELAVLGDWEFNLRVLMRWEIGLIRKPLANYHHRSNLQQTTYGNTVIGGAAAHYDLDAVIRNQLLRRELGSDDRLIGLVSSMSRAFDQLSLSLDSLHAKLDRQAADWQSVQHIFWGLAKVLAPARVGVQAARSLRERLRRLLSK